MRTVAKALTATGLDVLAQAICKDDTTACRVRSEEAKVTISDAVRLMHAAGLKPVPFGKVCVDRATYDALSAIATKAMANPDIARQLVWDDE